MISSCPMGGALCTGSAVSTSAALLKTVDSGRTVRALPCRPLLPGSRPMRREEEVLCVDTSSCFPMEGEVDDLGHCSRVMLTMNGTVTKLGWKQIETRHLSHGAISRRSGKVCETRLRPLSRPQINFFRDACPILQNASGSLQLEAYFRMCRPKHLLQGCSYTHSQEHS